jgi:HTH-type transcriptional regulator/antitoxin HigA
MEIRPIRNDADLMAGLAEAELLMDGDPAIGTPAGDKLDLLATLVEAYESDLHPIGKPDLFD